MADHKPFLVIHPHDSVAVALCATDPGAELPGGAGVAREAIPQGHKVALRTHERGDVIRKYGLPIGHATQSIPAGAHVHTHNLVTSLSGEQSYAPPTMMAVRRDCEAPELQNWRGYLRADGRAATRNEIWILPTVGCVSMTAEQMARAAMERHGGRIDGIYAFPHPHGCSQLGDDLAGTRTLLAGLAANPNAAGVLVLGLGCESNQIDALLAEMTPATREKVRVLSSQAVGDEFAEAGVLIDGLVDCAAAARRETLPLGALTVGLKCGGSDGFSGLTANPLLGRFSERLAEAGGTPVLTEIPEIFGAEQALLERARDSETFAKAAALVNRFKRYYLDQGLPVSENPSPGNLAGGITTLEEKSLGAVQKAGQAPLFAVVGYGDQAPAGGLALLEAPGNDAISSTALVAAGATLILFTTGRGTPLGFPVPTLKIASNRQLFEAKRHWIDFDASQALDTGRDATDRAFIERLLAIASGEPTAAERHGQRGIAIWKRGVTL